MIKFYLPDGHLEAPSINLFRRAGFRIDAHERRWLLPINDPNITIKRIRPQDSPFAIALGRGDLAITGSDILREFELSSNGHFASIQELLDLPLRKTKLVAAVSKEAMPDVQTIDDFKRVVEGRIKRGGETVVASEYPAIARQYLESRGIHTIVRRPSGKTEGWVLPPNPEADMIIDSSETGKTLQDNNCTIIDTIFESTSKLIANKKSLCDKEKGEKISELVELFRAVIDAEGRVIVSLNVHSNQQMQPILKELERFVRTPTISNLDGGGYDITVVMPERGLKDLLPRIKRLGASSISVSDARLFIG